CLAGNRLVESVEVGHVPPRDGSGLRPSPFARPGGTRDRTYRRTIGVRISLGERVRPRKRSSAVEPSIERREPLGFDGVVVADERDPVAGGCFESRVSHYVQVPFGDL